MVRWGLLVFLRDPNIRNMDKIGEQNRLDLSETWSEHKGDDTVFEYLGEDLVNQVRSALALDLVEVPSTHRIASKLTPAKRKRASCLKQT